MKLTRIGCLLPTKMKYWLLLFTFTRPEVSYFCDGAVLYAHCLQKYFNCFENMEIIFVPVHTQSYSVSKHELVFYLRSQCHNKMSAACHIKDRE